MNALLYEKIMRKKIIIGKQKLQAIFLTNMWYSFTEI